jgi:hypothetical protein
VKEAAADAGTVVVDKATELDAVGNAPTENLIHNSIADGILTGLI